MSFDPNLRLTPPPAAAPEPARSDLARERDPESGFTLLEILIVVTIIGLLMGFLANNFIRRADDAKLTLAVGQIKKLAQTLEFYKLDNGRYPTTQQGLQALVSEPSIDPAPRNYQSGGYTDDSQLQDPWGNPLRYETPGKNSNRGFDLCSDGPDGQAGSGGGDSDDICNYSQGRS